MKTNAKIVFRISNSKGGFKARITGGSLDTSWFEYIECDTLSDLYKEIGFYCANFATNSDCNADGHLQTEIIVEDFDLFIK